MVSSQGFGLPNSILLFLWAHLVDVSQLNTTKNFFIDIYFPDEALIVSNIY